MVIVTAIKERTQSRTAMKKVMDYVAQDYKTCLENENGEMRKLVSETMSDKIKCMLKNGVSNM